MNDSIEALGWTLVHFCWQAAAIALLYRVLDVAFLRSRSNVRYALALVSLMSMLVAGAATLGYEGQRISQESALRAQAAATGHALPHCDWSTPCITTDDIGNTPTRFNQNTSSFSRLTAYAWGLMPGKPMPLLPWIDALWLVGVLALSVRMLGGWMTIRGLQLSTKTKAPTSIYEAFLRLSKQMGIRRKVDLLVCSRISGPVAMGVLRSTILLPVSALTHLSPEQLEAVLAHELAHIRRGDYLWNMVQTMVETIFFFHPAVWWIGGRTRHLRELCCDDEALECCGDPIVYATALLRLEEQRSVRLHLAMALDGHSKGSSLKDRIIRILDGTQDEQSLRRRETVPLTLAGIVALISMFLMPLPHVSASRAAVVQGAASANVKIEAAPTTKPDGVTVKTEPRPKLDKLVVEARIGEPIEPVIEIAPLTPVASQSPIVAPAPVPAIKLAPLAPQAPPLPSVAPVAAPAPVVSLRVPAVIADVRINVHPSIYAMLQNNQNQAANQNHATNESYIKGMQELGYNDLDKLIAMKVQGITPEYARSMANIGYGKLSADDLLSLKIFGVTPETIEQLKTAGVAPKNIHELISYRIFKVTPEYAAQWKDAGFGSLPPEKLLQMRVQNLTPEYARSIRQKYPDVTVDQLVQMKIFRIDDEFIASAKSHGFNTLSIDKLIKLRMSALLDDNSVRR